MKKILLVAVLLLSVSFANAQFDLGIKAGYNSSLSLSNVASMSNGSYNIANVKSEMWNNFQGGVFARIGVSKKLYFQPEILYNMQKTNYTLTLNDVANKDVSYDKIININSYDIPLLIGYKVLDLKVMNIRAFAGPKLRFDTGNSSLEFSNLVKPAGSGSTVTLVGLQQDVVKSKIGLEIGAGIDILKLTVDVRYNIIGNMYKPVMNDYNLPSSTFSISLGWKIM